MDKYVEDANGNTWRYRFVCSRLERKENWMTHWGEVCGSDFLHMTPTELRFVADVMDRAQHQGSQDDDG